MKSETVILILCFALVALALAGSPSCSIKPALINWERRETPWFHWRKKEKPVEVEKGAPNDGH